MYYGYGVAHNGVKKENMGYSPGLRRQEEKGSPMYPSGQLQIGLWFTTSHLALIPQTPTHGFWHRRLTQARAGAHSLLMTHSGRQAGGAPKYPGKHVHTGRPSCSRHSALGPQGDGWQGSTGSVGRITSGMAEHWEKGSPVYPEWHVQMALWFCTEHSALMPHVPGQGSTHFELIQALSLGQS